LFQHGIPNRKAVILAVDEKKVRPKATFLTMHDQELLAAKNKGAKVRFVLAQETYFTDNDGHFRCLIEIVDKYAIRVRTDLDTSVWLNKQAILSTEVVA
jgi:hypothetical protein